MPVGAGRDSIADQDKDLEKRRKKLQKEINEGENKIKQAISEIDKAKRAIPVNEQEQTVIRAKIDEQIAVAQSFVDKLNAVKLY